MECYIHPSADYLSVPETTAKQRDFIYNSCQLVGHTCEDQPGLKCFGNGKRLGSALDIPGIEEGM